MWTVKTLQLGYPGKTTHHGGLGWSTIGLARDGQRVVILDTGGFPARQHLRDEYILMEFGKVESLHASRQRLFAQSPCASRNFIRPFCKMFEQGLRVPQ
jgi:hypothetical protein